MLSRSLNRNNSFNSTCPDLESPVHHLGTKCNNVSEKKKIIKLTHFEKAKQILYTFLRSHKAVRVAIFSSVHVHAIIQRNIFTQFMVMPVWEQQFSTILHTTWRPIYFWHYKQKKTCAENNLPWFRDVIWFLFNLMVFSPSACQCMWRKREREREKNPKHKHPITNPGRSW